MTFWLVESIKDKEFKDHYELGREIGRGATAVVHECHKHGSLDPWAVKIIQKKKDRKVASTEIGVLLHVNHERIIRLKEVYETQDDIYMVLELVTGGQLLDRLAQVPTYNEKSAAECIQQVMEGLKYLHEMEIIHRDLKPENVLFVDDSGESKVKLADFGLSHICSPEVQTLSVCGTPGFCAPELLLGQPCGAAVDMWAVGVISFVLLSGSEPFNSPDESVRYRSILRAQFHFDSPGWEGISKTAKDFVSRLLIVEPEKRMSAGQALQHPWLTGLAGREDQLESAQAGLRELNEGRKMRTAADALLATRHFILAGSNGIGHVAKSSTGREFEEQKTMETHCACPEEIIDVY